MYDNLWIYVDQHLRSGVQITSMIEKITKAFEMLHFFEQYLPIESLQTLYKSLQDLSVRYCCL